MSRPASSTPTSSSSTDQSLIGRLTVLVEALDSRFHDYPDAVIIKVRGLMDTSGELCAATLPSGEVYDELLGAEFEPHCDAVGLVVQGRARSMGDHEHEVGDVIGRAAVVFAVARDGTSVSSLRIDDAEPVLTTGGVDACVGRLADVVRRGFGLPTAAAAEPVASLSWHVWIHRLHVLALDAGPVTPDLIDAVRPDLPDSWAELRQQCADGRWPEFAIHPELAEWMDDGIFSRTCAQAFPELIEVMIELGELVDPSVWQYLIDRLAEAATVR